MAYTLKLDVFNHDLKIKDGKFEKISGPDQICQRVKIALWHYLGEYFLNREHGVPYYRSARSPVYILGSNMPRGILYNILRKKILEVPGVLNVRNDSITSIGRAYYYQCDIVVDSNDGTLTYPLQSIQLGE